MEDLHCIICGNDKSVRELYPQTFSEEMLTPAVFSARRVTEHWHYRIVRCTACSLIFSSPVLPRERLQELYGESTVTYSKEIAHITRSYARHLEPYLSAIPRKATAVEIGCGSGFFLEWLGTAGFDNLIGYEPSAAATASAPDAIRPRLRQCFFEVDESLPPGSVDLICSFQTLDHLTAPLRTLEKCRSLLYPGGTAFFITHNERALQARLLGEKSPIIDIEHIYLFNRKTLRLVFERAGFDVIDVISIQNTYSLLYWLSMTPIPLKGLARSAIRFLGLQDMPISLHAGNIGIIARSR